MRDDNEVLAPRIPINGEIGAQIYAALQRVAMHYGEIAVTISKERVAGGGYAYVITHSQPPARPAPKRG